MTWDRDGLPDLAPNTGFDDLSIGGLLVRLLLTIFTLFAAGAIAQERPANAVAQEHVLDPFAKASTSAFQFPGPFLVAPNGITGTITYRPDNIAYTNFAASPAALQYADVSTGQTTIFDVIGIARLGGRYFPTASLINFADNIANDVGFYSPRPGGPGFDLHIAHNDSPTFSDYNGRMGALEWDSTGNSATNMNIAFVPSTRTFQFGIGFSPSSPAVSGNDHSGVIQAGVRKTDPGCAVETDIGKQWFDTSTSTTAFKICKAVNGFVGWSVVNTTP